MPEPSSWIQKKSSVFFCIHDEDARGSPLAQLLFCLFFFLVLYPWFVKTFISLIIWDGVVLIKETPRANPLTRLLLCLVSWKTQQPGDFVAFLAVQNSSIGDLVTHWLSHSLTHSLSHWLLLLPYKEQSLRLATIETFDQSDEETWPD